MKRSPLRRTPFRRKATRSKGEFTAEAKAEMRRRSGGRCEAQTPICRGEGLVFHHIRRRGQGGKGTALNGLFICIPCHTYIHDHPAEAFKRGWLERSGDHET